MSVALHWYAVDSVTLIGWSGDHVMKKREGKMAGPCFIRLEAFSEDYFHRKKKVSGAHKGGAWLWRTWKGIGEEKRVPLGVRTVVLGLLNGEQGVPMGGAPHVYLRRVGNGLMYCMCPVDKRRSQQTLWSTLYSPVPSGQADIVKCAQLVGRSL